MNFAQSEMFMDVDAMKPGLDFVKQLDEQVSKCSVMLAIIGPGWLNARDEKGRRRLDLPRDSVRVELASALKREIPVIPLLVNGTAMPLRRRSARRPEAVGKPARSGAAPQPLCGRQRCGYPRLDRDNAGSKAIPPNGCRRSGGRGRVPVGRRLLPAARQRPAEYFHPIGGAQQCHESTASNTARESVPRRSYQCRSRSRPPPLPSLPPTINPASPIASSPAIGEPSKIALIIGNSKYPDADEPIKTPVNDARLIADGLKRAGFQVSVGENLTGNGMRQALEQFYGRIDTNSVALLFFAGYGVQSGRQTYLIPVDAQIWTESDVARDGFSLEALLRQMNARGAAMKVALVDASRRNPFERRFRSSSAGLTTVNIPAGTILMYSDAPGAVAASDGSGSGNTVFVTELLKNVGAPNLTAEDALNRTRVAISKSTNGRQVPWFASTLEDALTLGGALNASSPPPPMPASPSTPR
jgi:hypothetical protein